MNCLRGLFAAGLTAALFAMAAPANAADCCSPAPAPVCCTPAPVCCPPPVEVQWCVQDPVTCCTYSVSACVPACCAGVAPCYDGCRKGLFGRKILSYKFPGCDHCVDVVITKHGRTIVRG
jgi:hypothetical protein